MGICDTTPEELEMVMVACGVVVAVGRVGIVLVEGTVVAMEGCRGLPNGSTTAAGFIIAKFGGWPKLLVLILLL